MQINCIAIEDEPMALQKLISFIKDVPFLCLLESFDNSLDGVNFLNNNKVELLFLDIQMDKLNGIELLESLQQKPKVIITTAYSQYAIKGYELTVSDYLLKPYSFERFIIAVNKVYDELKIQKESKVVIEKPKSIFVKTAYQITKINLDEILYIEGMKDYIGIVTSKSRIMCLQNFQSVLSILPENDFVRVHKSFIVALDKIETISNHRIKIGEKIIPVSNSYLDLFYETIKKYRNLL